MIYILLMPRRRVSAVLKGMVRCIYSQAEEDEKCSGDAGFSGCPTI
jgi:hypothetical protein